MSYLFLALAIGSFFGFAMQSRLRNGHGMVYAAVLVGVWLLLALWSAGRFE